MTCVLFCRLYEIFFDGNFIISLYDNQEIKRKMKKQKEFNIIKLLIDIIKIFPIGNFLTYDQDFLNRK